MFEIQHHSDNAITIKMGGITLYISYTTIVAIDFYNQKIKGDKFYSKTTSKHITQMGAKDHKTIPQEQFDQIVGLLIQHFNFNQLLPQVVKIMNPTQTVRPLYTIALEIKLAWKNVHFSAAPYLNAMTTLTDISDRYGLDRADGIVSRFLSNAGAFRGAEARRLKAELQAILKTAG